MPSTRRHQLDIGVALGTTILILVLAPLGARSAGWFAGFAAELLMLAQPYALFRLVEHFRPLSARVRWGVIGCSGAGLLAVLSFPYPRPTALVIVTAVYCGAAQAYAGWLFADEAKRRTGITQRRLWLSTAGAVLAVALIIHEGIVWLTGARLLFPAQALMSLGVVGCYTLGLAPIRRLLRSWQRAEFVRFVVRTADRPPDERADRLAEDLNDAVTRSVTAATTTVFLGRDSLTAYASSDAGWGPVTVSPDAGLIGIALGGDEPVIGPPEDAEPPLEQLAEGDVVAVVPLGRASPRWGAIVLVVRRASVHLPDELAAIGKLSDHGADILDHARLTHLERQWGRHDEPEAPSFESAARPPG